MKKVLVILLATMMMLTMLTACGSVGMPGEESTSGSTSESGGDMADDTATDDTTGEMQVCRIVQPGTLSPEYEIGIAAVNEKLKADGLNIEVEVIRIPWDQYDQKLNVMLQTGDEFEVLHVMQDVKNLSTIAGMDALLPLDDMLANYPDLVSKFTDLEWQGTLINGEKYAVPAAWRNFDNVMSYVTARTDVMNAVGYDEFPTDDAEAVKDLMIKSQEYILEETGTKAYNWYHQNQDTAHWLHRTYDSYPFYVENSLGLVLAHQDGTIESFYESDEFKMDAEYYYELYQAGLINPDILNLDSQVKYDQADYGAFLPSQTFDPSFEVRMENTAGITSDVNVYSMFPEKPEMMYTYTQNLNAISATSPHPEVGLEFLNWLYASKENHDLFHYGIEGQHFTAVGEDRMDQAKDESGGALYFMDTWMTGYLPYMRFDSTLPQEQVNFQKGFENGNLGTMEETSTYVVSPIAGFIFDSSPVSAELTNLQTEIISSIYPIKVGMVSYEENIDKAIENLKAAGLDAYMAEYQKQFDAYLAANPQVLELAQVQNYGE